MCLHYIILTIDDIPAKKIKFSEIRYSLCKPAIYYILPIYLCCIQQINETTNNTRRNYNCSVQYYTLISGSGSDLSQSGPDTTVPGTQVHF